MKLARLIALLAVICWQLAPATTFAANTAATVQKPVTSGNCASYGTYPNVADSGVGCTNHQVTISDGTHGTMLLAPSTLILPNSPAILNNTSAQPLLLTRGVASTGADAADYDVRRTANYVGGTFGFVNSAIRCTDTVSAGTTSFEWCGLDIVDNHATSADNSENVGRYMTCHKFGTGKCWGAVTEIIDTTGANPTRSTVTHEFDNETIGGDSSLSKIINDLWAKSYDGNPATTSFGARLNTDAHTTVTNGFTTYGATIGNAAFAMGASQKLCMDGATCANYITQASNQTHIWAGGSDALQVTTLGVNVPALNSLAGGITLPSGQKLCLDATTCSNYLTQSGGTVSLFAGGSNSASFTSSANNLGLVNALAVNSSGQVTIAGGQNLCLDGTTCHNYLTEVGGTVLHFYANNVDSLQVSSIGSNMPALSTTSSGVTIPTGQKYCLDGTACANYLSQSGGTVTVGATAGGAGTSSVTGIGINTPALNATAGAVTLPSGQKLCLDGTTCANYLTQSGGAITVAASGSGATLPATTAPTLTSTGNVVAPTSGKICLDGATCSTYITFTGSAIAFYIGGSLQASIASGYVGAQVGYIAGGNVGQNCLAGSHASYGGIIVTC